MAVTINGNGAVTGLTALPDSAMAEGSVIQVVSTIKKDAFTTNTSNNFVEVTGLNVTITPTSSSNKLFFQLDLTWGIASNTVFAGKLYDGSSEITGATSSFGSTRAAWFQAYAKASTDTIASDRINHLTHSYLHQVSDTNTHTYKIYINCGSANASVNRRQSEADFGSTSTFTVMELVA